MDYLLELDNYEKGQVVGTKKNYGELDSELYPYTEEDLLGLPRYHSLNLIKCDEDYGKFITKLPKPIS